jgi:hypothetical protein
MSIVPQDYSEGERWGEVAVMAGLALVPTVGGSLSVVAGEMYERRRRRVAQFGSDVLADRSADELIDRLRSDERFGELFVRAATSVATTWWAPKRAAMGNVVRAALAGDDAAVDESEMLLLALERLDAPHFAALARLTESAATADEKAIGVASADVQGLTAPVLSALLSVGAVAQESAWGGLLCQPTDFGLRLLALVAM